jgi:hypothetical protein
VSVKFFTFISDFRVKLLPTDTLCIIGSANAIVTGAGFEEQSGVQTPHHTHPVTNSLIQHHKYDTAFTA